MLGARRHLGAIMGDRPTVSILLAAALLTTAWGGAAPPANDAFASATPVVALPLSETVDTSEATLQSAEPQPPCSPGQVAHTIWYRVTLPVETLVSVDTLGSDFDSVLAVWTGPSLGSLEPVACADDAFSLDAQVAFRAHGGITYHIQIGGLEGAAGSLVVRLRTLAGAVIEGEVTRSGGGAPLPGICVDAIDRDLLSGQTAVTGEDGSYELIVRPGSYLVAFIDLCDARDDRLPEWFDDVPFDKPEDATPLDLSSGDVASGVDAALDLGCPRLATLAALGGFNQVIGTGEDDVLVGTPDDDVICGKRGDDIIRGLGGLDILLGGKGRDRLRGGQGDDELVSGPGPDELLGGPGSDLLLAGQGNDRLRGGAGDDLMLGGRGRDVCSGGPGLDMARGCETARGVIRSSAREIVRGAAARPRALGLVRAAAPRELLLELLRG